MTPTAEANSETFRWPESPKAVRRSRPADTPPIGKLILKKPWLYRKLLSGDIPRG